MRFRIQESVMKRALKPLARFALAVIAISLTAIISQAQSGWTSKRIGSGGKDLNAVYFTDAKHGWVGGDEFVWRAVPVDDAGVRA